MKKILVLVAGESNLPFIQAAKQLGLYVITCDNNPSNPGHKIADENLFIDVYDHDAIIEAVKDKNIDGVMSFVSAHGLKTAAIVSEHYHLHGYSEDAIMTLTDKGLFRNFLSKNRLNYPTYQCVHNLSDIDFKQLVYPVIIKPTDKGGSQGVVKINNENELIENFQETKNFSDSNTVIIEEFLEGEELINGDCIVYNGKIIGNITGNYMYDNETNNVLPIATVFPAGFDASETIIQLSEIVESLKIPNGIINFEAIIKDKRPHIIEINPRPSGNYIWKLMGYKYDIDIPNFLISQYLTSTSRDVTLFNSNDKNYAYQLIYSDENKTFEGYKIPPELEKNVLDSYIFKQTGAEINKFNNLSDRIGLLLLEFNETDKRLFYTDNRKLFKL